MLSTPDNLVRNGSYFPAVVPQPFLHVARTALANAMDGIFAARDSCSALCSGANALRRRQLLGRSRQHGAVRLRAVPRGQRVRGWLDVAVAVRRGLYV